MSIHGIHTWGLVKIHLFGFSTCPLSLCVWRRSSCKGKCNIAKLSSSSSQTELGWSLDLFLNSPTHPPQGFQFRFRRGGGISPEGGGMARDADATIWLLNCEYAMALYHHFMLLQTCLKYFQRRINPKVKYFKKLTIYAIWMHLPWPRALIFLGILKCINHFFVREDKGCDPVVLCILLINF